MKLGIFGGTFDPPHLGHLIVADDAAAALKLDRVHFVPAGQHPLKRRAVEAPGQLRLEMVAAATAGSGLFVPDGREVQRPGPSYTINTIEELRGEFPAAELFVLVGADILAEIHLWHRAAEIAERARLVVMSRPDMRALAPEGKEIAFERVEVSQIAISSTDVRERVRSGRPYRYLVPEPVRRIIAGQSLYGEPLLT